MSDDPLWVRLGQWARLRSRSALVVVGALDGDAARAFARRLVAGDVLPIPIDAHDARSADVLVVLGRIGHKLAPALRATRRQIAPGGVVLAFDTAEPLHAIAQRTDDVIDVDVVVRGIPPGDAVVARALAALDRAFAHASNGRRTAGGDGDSGDDVDAEPA
jgi:hypothetical protein